MPARIEVVEGPDRGFQYEFGGTDVRIGREVGHHIRLTDPDWQTGDIRIQVRQGGYLVTNLLPHPIYLDGQTIPASQSRTFHHGAILQPTAHTVLRFSPTPTPNDLPANGGVSVRPPAKPPKSTFWRNVSAVVLMLAAAGYWYSRTEEAFDPASADAHKRTTEAVVEKVATEPRLAPQAAALRVALVDAVYQEHAGKPRAAAVHYRAARDSAERLLRETDLDVPLRARLEALQQFVGTRLRTTSSR